MGKGICLGWRRAKTLRILAVVIPLLLGEAGAQTFTSIHQFGPTPGSDGNRPYTVHLIQASDGNFYGTTEFGGTNGVGTVFRITPAGTETVLYQFGFSAPNEGYTPEAGVVQGSNGNFYGTTYAGGTNHYGTVFKMTPSGVLTNIHTFTGNPDGNTPFAPLVLGTDGFLYGTTSAGGAHGYGCVFKIDTTGDLTVIWSFTNGLDGSDPYAGVYQGSDGEFYGAAYYGGGSANCSFGGCGTVYKVTSAGTFTSLHQFGYTPSDGQHPMGGIVQGYVGDYFGTTTAGGTNSEGTVFRITSAGTLTTLYQFGGLNEDGLTPEAGLMQNSDGYLYGVTFEGGTNGVGTLFKIGPGGGLVYVHDFDAFIGDGLYPNGSPVEGFDGNLYGTATAGGTNSGGTVYTFKFPVPTNPNEPNITETGGGNNPNGTNVVFSFSSVAGETYQLQSANALSASTIWSNVPGASVSNAIGGPLSFTNFISGTISQQFYRFAITP